MLREIILDTETTGLDPRTGHKIIEIGAVEMIDKVITGKKFHHYINPKRDVPQEAYKIHGISTAFLKNKPTFSVIVDEFLQFVNGARFVIHNAQFDIKFLNHELSLLGKSSFNLSDAICTLEVARGKFPGHKVNLDALCRRYKVDASSRVFHGALKDAELLAKVYLHLIDYTEQFNFILDKPNNIKYTTENLNTFKTRIVYPTPQELLAHNKFINSFDK